MEMCLFSTDASKYGEMFKSISLYKGQLQVKGVRCLKPGGGALHLETRGWFGGSGREDECSEEWKVSKHTGRCWIMKVFECLGEDSVYPTRLLQIWQAPQVISLCPVGYVLD